MKQLISGQKDFILHGDISPCTEKVENKYIPIQVPEGDKTRYLHRFKGKSVAFYVHQYSSEGYELNRATLVNISADDILLLAERIKELNAEPVVLDTVENDDLPF